MEHYPANPTPYPTPPVAVSAQGLAALAALAAETSDAPDAPPAVMALPQRRMWPVLLTLYVLAPVLAELLSGSTPPLLFVQPFSLLFIPLLYGSSALLIREILAQRRLGWGNALILGAAFGVFQEALIVQTWYNFMARSSPSHSNGLYGVWLSTNWVWALNLTLYHAVISITLPLIALTLLFPQRALAPGLQRRGVILLLLWLLIPCGLLAVAVARSQYAAQGYHGPPQTGYLIGCALVVGLTLVGTFARIPSPRRAAGPAGWSAGGSGGSAGTAGSARIGEKRAPGVWMVRITVFVLTAAFFLLTFLLPSVRLPSPLAMTISAGIFGFGVWRIASWSMRTGWNARHWLALIMGVQAWDLILWAPLVEYVVRLPMREGLTLANLIVAVALFVFDWRLTWRLARRDAHSPSPIAPAPLHPD